MSTLDEVISRAVQTAVHKYMDVFLQIVSEKYQINQDELKALLSQSSTGGNKEYAKLNLKQLRSLCKERNIKQFSLKKKGSNKEREEEKRRKKDRQTERPKLERCHSFVRLSREDDCQGC